MPAAENGTSRTSEAASTGEKSRTNQPTVPPSLPTQDASADKKTEKAPSPVLNPQQSLVQVPSVATSTAPTTSTAPQAAPVSGQEQKPPVPQGTATPIPDEQKPAKTASEVPPQAPVAAAEHDTLKSSSETNLAPELTPQQTDSQLHCPPTVDELPPPVAQPEGEWKQGGAMERSTKLSIFPSQSQQDPQQPTTNGSGKKKVVRGKVKLRLNGVSGDKDKVVKCSLVTSVGQMVNFQFSMVYDKPQEIFQKFVSPILVLSCPVGLCHYVAYPVVLHSVENILVFAHMLLY